MDIDDTSYHGCALNQRTCEVPDFYYRPTLYGSAGQRENLREYFGAVQLKLRYEAPCIGFSFRCSDQLNPQTV